MDYSLLVAVDDKTGEIVVGIVGKLDGDFVWRYAWPFFRLHSNIYLGQATWNNFKRVYFWEGRTYHYYTEAI